MEVYHDLSVDECKAKCDANSKCKAFEYSVASSGNDKYQPRDCLMQDTGKLNDCDGDYWGMDLYIKGRQNDAEVLEAECICKARFDSFDYRC